MLTMLIGALAVIAAIAAAALVFVVLAWLWSEGVIQIVLQVALGLLLIGGVIHFGLR